MSIQPGSEVDRIEFRVPVEAHDFNYITLNGHGIYDLLRFGYRKLGVKAAAREARKLREEQGRNYGGALPRVPYWIVAGGAGALAQHFLREPSEGEAEVYIYICSCDDAGCGNTHALVRSTRRLVYWRFPNHLGSFTFRREDYEAAIRRSALRP